ncbi:MAG TPA: PEP-CTERM sorting domain-containing protein [Sphingomonas sp.]|nr:PEP-CTERM sorting domain-containing protein [Sphingomonas sp.]
MSRRLACLVSLLCVLAASRLSAERILFVGNSFTFGTGSAVQRYRPESVRDLNRRGQSGVPALFRIFAEQAGIDWEVSLEATGGQDFAFHLANKRAELAGMWDVVVLQDYSTLDRRKPGDATAHVRDAARLAAMFRAANPRARILLETSWSRADMAHAPGTRWSGKPIRAMTDDIARANALAIVEAPGLFAGTLPVGEAWLRAMADGVADPDPYDGIAPGKISLWASDGHHASAEGSYLAALVIFGRVTGADPRRLGRGETAAAALGIRPGLAASLQRIAAEELVALR